MKKIGEAAALFDTTPRTLLYYEEQGIIAPAKTEKGTRMYSDSDMRRFGTAYELVNLGIPLRAIREISDVGSDEIDPNACIRKQSLMLGTLAEELREQIKRIERAARDIEAGRVLMERELANAEADDEREITAADRLVALLNEHGEPVILSLLESCRDDTGSSLVDSGAGDSNDSPDDTLLRVRPS